VKDGLSLTISLDKKKYKPDEKITLHFELKNVYEKAMWVGDGFLAPEYHEAGPGRHFEVHVTADEGHQLYFWSGAETEGPQGAVRRVVALESGATYKGDIRLYRRFAAGQPPDEQGGAFEDTETRRNHVLGVDGHLYQVTLRYQVDSRTHRVWEALSDFSAEGLWEGVIDSAALVFEVHAADKEKK